MNEPPGNAVASAAGAAGPNHVDDHVSCLRCGYDLHGLNRSNACPECGTAVERTLDGNLLRFSSPAYLTKLSRGVLLIILSYILTVAMLVVLVPVGMAIGLWTAAGASPDIALVVVFAIGASLVGLAIGILSLIGWWMFSEPDPDFIGNDTAHSYRLSVRVLVATFAAIMVVSAPFDVLSLITDTWAYEVASTALGLFIGLLSVVLFFVSLLYVRVIAARIPDQAMVQRAGIYLWLLPVIYIVGACILIGPIIATVMYLVLLWRLRKHVVTILDQMEVAAMPDVA